MTGGYLYDAWYTAESIRRDLVSKMEAGTALTPDEVEAYDRALATLKDQRVLWENQDGLLDVGHDHVWEEMSER